MNFESVARELTIKNDIDNLSIEELSNKYGKDEEAFLDFLQSFSSMFIGKNIYPVMILNEYDKIRGFLLHTYRDVDLAEDKHLLLCNIMIEMLGNESCDYSEEDIGQAVFLFGDIVGYNKMKKSTIPFKDLTGNMIECTKILSNAGNLSKDEVFRFLDENGYQLKNREMIIGALNDFYDNHYGTYTFVDRQRINDTLQKYEVVNRDVVYDEYKKINPKIALCYNPNFLFLANYMMNLHQDCCTEEYLDLIREVIDISTNLGELEPSEFDRSNYLRVAKFTLKNVNKVDKKTKLDNNPITKIKKRFNKS